MVDDVEINIVYDGIIDDTPNLRKIKKVLHDCILNGITACVRAAIDLAEIIVPESSAAPGRYGDTYVSEKLLQTFITYLNMSLLELSTGRQTLRPKYIIEQEGWEHVSYAEYVNLMEEVSGAYSTATGRGWSKATSQARFIETIDRFLRTQMAIYIQNELDKGAPTGVKLLFTVS